jgi:hypothetical protein
MTSDFLIGGLSAETVYDKLTATGVSKYEANQLVGQWILEKGGVQQRVFDFTTPLAAVDPDCAATFTRSFQHIDWIDGESTVQAAQSVGEDGFNVRMHRIEADLDSVDADAATAIECLAELRAAVATLLGEVKLELNRINADLQRLAVAGGGETRAVIPGPSQILAGATFAGTGIVKGQHVQMWQTATGVIVMPSPLTGGTDPIVDPVAMKAPQLALLFAGQPALAKAVTGGMAVADLVTRFGGLTSPAGLTFADLMATFPGSATFDTTQVVVGQLADHDAISIAAQGTRDAVFANTFATTGPLANPSAASVTDLTTIDAAAKSALLEAGITTVGALIEAGPVTFQQVLERNKITVAPGMAESVVAGLAVVQKVASFGSR